MQPIDVLSYVPWIQGGALALADRKLDETYLSSQEVMDDFGKMDAGKILGVCVIGAVAVASWYNSDVDYFKWVEYMAEIIHGDCDEGDLCVIEDAEMTVSDWQDDSMTSESDVRMLLQVAGKRFA